MSSESDNDQGYKWWLRYIIVPLIVACIGGSGVIGIIIGLRSIVLPTTPNAVTEPTSTATLILPTHTPVLSNDSPKPEFPTNTPIPTPTQDIIVVTNGDFSTPRSTIETFIAAGVARDLELLSQVFSDEAAGEFDPLRNKTASEEELDSLASFVEGAEITGVEINDDQTMAIVYVKFSSRDEEIYLIKTAHGWQIVDF